MRQRHKLAAPDAPPDRFGVDFQIGSATYKGVKMRSSSTQKEGKNPMSLGIPHTA